MFRIRELTTRAGEKAAAQAAAMASSPEVSAQLSPNYQGLERAELSLTCRQGDFAEDPS
jgi:hypothetical protein